jgi:hypothetical protein
MSKNKMRYVCSTWPGDTPDFDNGFYDILQYRDVKSPYYGEYVALLSR